MKFGISEKAYGKLKKNNHSIYLIECCYIFLNKCKRMLGHLTSLKSRVPIKPLHLIEVSYHGAIVNFKSLERSFLSFFFFTINHAFSFKQKTINFFKRLFTLLFVLILPSSGPSPIISARRGRGMRIKKKGLDGGMWRKRGWMVCFSWIFYFLNWKKKCVGPGDTSH